MHHCTKRLLVLGAALSLSSCLWGPGKFASDLTLNKDGRFVLNYRGEIVLQLPPDASAPDPWKSTMAKCFVGADGTKWPQVSIAEPGGTPKERVCTAPEIASQKSEYEKDADRKRKQAEEMAKMFGLGGFDDASNRAFAAKLMKYAGWRSVTYRGKGVFDVDYHFAGRATQDFAFPTLPENDIVIPFVAIRRRSDGSVLVTAPAMTGAIGPLGVRAGTTAMSGRDGMPVSRAEGRFTIVTDGEILTNNSEDGPGQHASGRQIQWNVNSSFNKIPEALIRLQ